MTLLQEEGPSPDPLKNARYAHMFSLVHADCSAQLSRAGEAWQGLPFTREQSCSQTVLNKHVLINTLEDPREIGKHTLSES